jgi:serine/threonine-protein kinase
MIGQIWEPGVTIAHEKVSAKVVCSGEPSVHAGMRLGRYRLIERLAHGCQGEVWRALQVDPIVEEVALKLVWGKQAEHPGLRSQFHREAMWGARLRSPWLLPTYEFGVERGIVYLAQPLVEGASLAELIVRYQRWSQGAVAPRRHWLEQIPRATYLGAVVTITARIARGLAVAHAAHVAHRDVKPANILVDRSRPGRVFLCDFGLGRDFRNSEPAILCENAGTPLYMAPERLLRLPSDEVLCDVYALGVTLAEAATLVCPFSIPRGLPPSRWPEYLAHSPPRDLGVVAPWLPVTMQAIIHRAMNRDSRGRYPTMTSFAEDLEQTLA